MNKSVETIIHKSKFRLITNDIQEYNRKRRRELEYQRKQRDQNNGDKPYAPLGRLNNVLFVLDAVK